jgi:2-oxoisovalerate dehydrogenase E2 component (dihydrolipoyl transacylase)
VNATFGGAYVLRHGAINIGISVGLDDRVVVPVIRDADDLSVAGLARAIHSITEQTRHKQLRPDDVTGATFTVNNSGTFGTMFSYSIISPGQAGVLTMGAIHEAPVAMNGGIAIRHRMYLCFSLDHRIMDGLIAAHFLSACRLWLESVTATTSLE